MTARKRPAKKAAKRTNSNITAAQKATSDARKARATAAQKKAEQGSAKANEAKLAAAKAAVDPHQPSRPVLEQNLKPGQTLPGKGNDATPAFKAATQSANKIAGIATGLMQQHQTTAAAQRSKLADTSLYGASDAKRAQKLSEASAAYADQRAKQILAQKGSAVWMGTTKKAVKLRNQGPERVGEDGGSTSTQTVELADVKTKDELMSWLADEGTFNQIKKRMNDSGIAVQTYDDVAKLWSSVVDQAAASYSLTGKKVTPWALLSLRGKNMVNGKPAAKTTTSTNIDEMDPAQAKVMIKNTLSQMLGRDPQKSEIEDFIAKAQTIARQNPQITNTTTQYDFAGSPTSQTSVSRGGGDAVTAKAQLAAEEQAKQSEDYAAYQGAGVMMPWLMDALSSPV